MENLLRPYDKECMRMAMLKHEETFTQQVHDLRCLYRIQKTLMQSIECSRPNKSFSLKNVSMHSRTRLDLEHQDAEVNRNTMLEAIDESEIELALDPARYLPRKKRGTPLTSDFAPSFSSSSSTESSHMKKTSTTKADFNVTDMTFGYQNGSKNNTDLEEHFRQERLKQPPWLFQVLSMNMN